MIDWSAIETVLLDMDGTLLDLYFDNYFWMQYLPQKYAEARHISLDAAKTELFAQFGAHRGTLNWYCLDFWSKETGLDIVGLKRDVTEHIGVRPNALTFLERVKASGRKAVLVTNAHRGLEPVADAELDHWRWMWETNVIGTLRVTRALLPKLIESGDGLIVTVTSVAALEVYDGGAGYTAAKHGQGALHRTLRGELLGKPVRLTEIAPGAVETEFSLVRFDGDQQRADAVYTGITPLVAADVAEVIGFVASRPAHVDLDLIVMKPRDQASASRFNRRG